MMRPRARLALAAAALAILAAGLVLALGRPGSALPPPRPAAERPELMLLTTLPLVFAEQFSLDVPASPALEALSSRYRVVPVSTAAASELNARRLLLMAQPQAQPAEILVELDAWVRGGGRLLLLADPALAWPSERPLGDLLRPPAAFADTGLLGHWGLELRPPQAPGEANVRAGALTIATRSPGTLVATGAACTVESGLIARCRLGRGQAVVIADADFLDVAEGSAGDSNLALLLGELERLER